MTAKDRLNELRLLAAQLTELVTLEVLTGAEVVTLKTSMHDKVVETATEAYIAIN